MLNLINLKTSALILFLIIACCSCASSPITSPTTSPNQPQSCPTTSIAQTPPSYPVEPEIDLSNRTLEIDPADKSARLYYPFRVCTKRFIICVAWAQVRIYYDLLNQDTKMALKNKDFVCRVRDKP